MLWATAAFCETGAFTRDAITAEYSGEVYIVGIGQAVKSEHPQIDIRTAELAARSEIAASIKGHMREEQLSAICDDGYLPRILESSFGCRDALSEAIDETVAQALTISRVVKQGVDGGVVYMVSVLPRESAIIRLEGYFNDAILKTKSKIKEARATGSSSAVSDATDFYTRAIVYEREIDAIEGVQGNPSPIFAELGREILKLKD